MTPLDVNTDPLSFEVPVTPTIEQAESEELGEPILFGEIDTPHISPTLLPDWLCSYVTAVSEHTQTPVEMAIMYSLSVLATCLQGKVQITPDGSDYTEPVNIWTVTALPPASRKSAVVKALTFPLTDWEKAEAEKLKPLIEEREAERLVNQKRISELQSKAAKLESAQDRSQLIREIGNLKTSTPDEMRAPQLFTCDATPEQLQNMLVDHGERMSFLSDEGGIFEVMTGLYNDGKSNIDVFLQAHAGTSVRVNRAQRSVMLNNPALTFGLTVQPAVIADLNKGDKRRLRGVGALARFLYCIPESNIGSRDATKAKPIPDHARDIYKTSIERLLKIGKTDLLSKSPIKLTLNKEALSVFHAFAQAIENDQGPGRKYENIQDWTGKLPGAALRIAALFHVAEFGTITEVSSETMDKAAELCTLLIPHTEKAFELMSREPSLDDARYLWDWLVREGKPDFHKRDAHRLPRFVKSTAKRVEQALGILVERNLISGRQYRDTKKPTQYHTINPICLVKRDD